MFVEKLKRILGWLASAVVIVVGAWLVRLKLKAPSPAAPPPTELPPAPPEVVANVVKVETQSEAARTAATAAAVATTETLAEISDEQEGAKRRKMLADLANKT